MLLNLTKNHSYRSLGSDYAVNVDVEYVPDSRLVLFNRELTKSLKLNLPESDKELEQFMLENFALFKYGTHDCNRKTSKKTMTFFATRYLDSDDKSEGNALGDGRAIWVGEIVNKLDSGAFQYLDVVLKGTGITELAWFNHPKESHRDGQVGITEAVHEYIYSSAAIKNGISSSAILAVIKLPFDREIDNESAAIIVRVGNHLRFAHYHYFSDNPVQLKEIFEYGLKRDRGLPLTYSLKIGDTQNHLDFIVTNLASDAATYFDVHAVHGSPTFGNVTSCGGSIDFSTFVYLDAHHGHYSYMSDNENSLGGVCGQTEQFFNLFSILVDALKKSQFEHATEILPVEYFLRKFNDVLQHKLTYRWLVRIGLSKEEINRLSADSKDRFYEIIKIIYELKGLKKIQFNQKKIFMAAFEPRKIMSGTADCIESFDSPLIIWNKLFKVNRHWGTYTQEDAKPYIDIYLKSIIVIIDELKASKETIAAWKQRSKTIRLSERNEPGTDFFYGSERFLASTEVLQQISLGNISWQEMSKTANTTASALADHGLYS